MLSKLDAVEIISKNEEEPSNPTLRHISRENHNSKGCMHPDVHCSTIYNSQDMEAPKCPSTEEWIKKMWYIYTVEY